MSSKGLFYRGGGYFEEDISLGKFIVGVNFFLVLFVFYGVIGEDIFWLMFVVFLEGYIFWFGLFVGMVFFWYVVIMGVEWVRYG